MLCERNLSLFLFSSISQLLSKSITNKIAVSSKRGTLFKNQIFIGVFVIEHYEYAALRKELLLAPFVELFKTTNLRKLYL